MSRSLARKAASLAYINSRAGHSVESFDNLISIKADWMTQRREAASLREKIQLSQSIAFYKDAIDHGLCDGQRIERVWLDDSHTECVTENGSLSKICPSGSILCPDRKCAWKIAETARDSALLRADVIADRGIAGQAWFFTATHRGVVNLKTGAAYNFETFLAVEARVKSAGGEILIAAQEIPVKFLMTERAVFWPHLHAVVWLPMGADLGKIRLDRVDVDAKVIDAVTPLVDMVDYCLKGYLSGARKPAELLHSDASLNPADLLDLIALGREDNSGDALIAAGQRAMEMYLKFMKWSYGGYIRKSRVSGTTLIRVPRRGKVAPASRAFRMSRHLPWRHRGGYDPAIAMGEVKSAALAGQIARNRVPDLADLQALADFCITDEIPVGVPLDLSTLTEIPRSIVDMNIENDADFWRWQAELEEISV